MWLFMMEDLIMLTPDFPWSQLAGTEVWLLPGTMHEPPGLPQSLSDPLHLSNFLPGSPKALEFVTSRLEGLVLFLLTGHEAFIIA